MKKIIAIAIVIVLMFSMTACSGAPIPMHTANWGKSNVAETSEYKITVEKSEGLLDKNAPRLTGSGTYVTSITGGSATGYEVTTKMNFKGEYELVDGTKIPVNDIVESSVNFRDLIFDFKPIKSEKSYKGKTVKYLDGKYTVEDLTYSTVIEYNDNRAKVKNTGDYVEGFFEVPTNSTLLIDNEQLFYLVRSFVKAEGTGISFSLVNGMSKSAIVMSANINANTIVENDVTINGKTSKMKMYPVGIRKASNTETGTAIIAYCAVDDKGSVNTETGGKINVDRSRVVKIVQQVPYTFDILTFDLVKYSYGEIK